MLFLASLFLLGSLWFWIMLVVVSIIIISFDYFDRSGRAFTTMFLFLLAVTYFNEPVRDYVLHHPLSILLGILAYIAIGAVWMFIRWPLFLLDVREAKKEQEIKNEEDWAKELARDEADRVRRATALPVPGRALRYDVDDEQARAGLSPRAKQRITSLTVRGRTIPFPVKMRDHKARVIGWMTYWPWSALWTGLDLVFHRVFQHIYTLFAGRLQAMADRMTGDPVTEVAELQEDAKRPTRTV
jgi:hypothetical protein